MFKYIVSLSGKMNGQRNPTMRIVFVCTANMCRSAFAEAVMKQELARNGIIDVEVHSVGLKDMHGTSRDPEMIRLAAEYGYPMSGTTVFFRDIRPVVEGADLILAMSEYHRNELTKVIPYNRWNRIHLFNEYCSGDKTEVPDPFYQSEAVYRNSIEMIVNGCKNLLQKILIGSI